jgi:hypothetical protein
MAHLLNPETEKCTVGIHCQVCNVGQAGRLNALSEMFSLSLASPAKHGNNTGQKLFLLTYLPVSNYLWALQNALQQVNIRKQSTVRISGWFFCMFLSEFRSDH